MKCPNLVPDTFILQLGIVFVTIFEPRAGTFCVLIRCRQLALFGASDITHLMQRKAAQDRSVCASQPDSDAVRRVTVRIAYGYTTCE